MDLDAGIARRDGVTPKPEVALGTAYQPSLTFRFLVAILVEIHVRRSDYRP